MVIMLFKSEYIYFSIIVIIISAPVIRDQHHLHTHTFEMT